MEFNDDSISVVIPAYNAEENIGRVIESVLDQSHKNFELIIINDGSNDSTQTIVDVYQASDPRIVSVNLEKNNGVANARNIGIEKASKEYIAFLDSDDTWEPQKLEKQINFMNEMKVEFSYTDYELVSTTRNKIFSPKHKVNYNDLLTQNIIGCSTVMIKSEIIKKYKLKNIGHEDFLLWLEILNELDYAYKADGIKSYYTVSRHSLSGNKIKSSRWQWNVYRNELNLSFLKSIRYFVEYSYNAVIKHY